MAIGGDQGGSIRIPSSYQGIGECPQKETFAELWFVQRLLVVYIHMKMQTIVFTCGVYEILSMWIQIVYIGILSEESSYLLRAHDLSNC